MKVHYNQVKKDILEVKLDKRTDVFTNGADNKLPSLIELLISISVTAKTCIDRASKAIFGGGFGTKGKIIVNSSGQSLNEVLRLSSIEYAKHNNVYLHLGYNLLGEISSINILTNVEVRIGKEDNLEYSNDFVIYDNWDRSKGSNIKSSKFKYVKKYSKNKEILASQIEFNGIETFTGHILHIKKDSLKKYSTSDLVPVMGECLLESNSQKFRSTGSEKGFLNTKVLARQPFKDKDEKKEFTTALNDFRGADNSSDILILEASQVTDDLSKQLYLGDLTGEYNDTIFEYSDSQAEKNICKSTNVDLILVNPSADSSMFGNSGEARREAKKQLSENKEEQRNQLEEAFAGIMENFRFPIENLQIIDPYAETEEEVEAKNINKEAQAKLRGSVGGSNALVSIAKDVKAKLIDKDQAVEIIKNIFGYTDKKAKKMIGGFDNE